MSGLPSPPRNGQAATNGPEVPAPGVSRNHQTSEGIESRPIKGVIEWIEAGWLVVSRPRAAYYFLHFLVILPLLGWLERPIPLPISISAPALGSTGAR